MEQIKAHKLVREKNHKKKKYVKLQCFNLGKQIGGGYGEEDRCDCQDEL